MVIFLETTGIQKGKVNAVLEIPVYIVAYISNTQNALSPKLSNVF